MFLKTDNDIGGKYYAHLIKVNTFSDTNVFSTYAFCTQASTKYMYYIEMNSGYMYTVLSDD